jgi:hypothetical protein
MREEYLANMSAFEEKIPDLLTNRLRIEKMSTAKVKEAITGPCNYAEIGIENEAVETIIEKLTRQGKTIELTYLQVLLDRLFHKAAEEQKGDNLQFTQSLVTSLGEVSDILGDFLEEQIRQFDNPDQVLDVLKSFVSIRGTKRQSTVEEIGNHLRSLNKAQETDTLQTTIQQLVNLRILREKDENDRYELRHDALAMKIYEKISQFEKELMEIRHFIENARINFEKRGKLLTKDDLKYLAPYEDKLYLPKAEQNLLDKSKQYHTRIKRRKRMLTGLAATLIIIIAVIYSINSYYAQQEAELQYRISQSKNIANQALSMMEDDPTMAYCLGEAAWKIHPTLEAEKALIKSYRRGPFYENKLPGKTSRDYVQYETSNTSNTIKISPDGKFLMINSDTSKDILISDYKGNVKTILKNNFYPFKEWCYFSNDNKTIVTYDAVNFYYNIWDYNGNKKLSVDTRVPILFYMNNDSLLEQEIKYNENMFDHSWENMQMITHNYSSKEPKFYFHTKLIDFKYKGIPMAYHKKDGHLVTAITKKPFGIVNKQTRFYIYKNKKLYDSLYFKASKTQSFIFTDDGMFLAYNDTIYDIKSKRKSRFTEYEITAPLYGNYYLSQKKDYSCIVNLENSVQDWTSYKFYHAFTNENYLGWIENYDDLIFTKNEKITVFNIQGKYENEFTLPQEVALGRNQKFIHNSHFLILTTQQRNRDGFIALSLPSYEVKYQTNPSKRNNIVCNKNQDNIALIDSLHATIIDSKPFQKIQKIHFPDSLFAIVSNKVWETYPFAPLINLQGDSYIYNLQTQKYFKTSFKTDLKYNNPAALIFNVFDINNEFFILTINESGQKLYNSKGEVLDILSENKKNFTRDIFKVKSSQKKLFFAMFDIDLVLKRNKKTWNHAYYLPNQNDIYTYSLDSKTLKKEVSLEDRFNPFVNGVEKIYPNQDYIFETMANYYYFNKNSVLIDKFEHTKNLFIPHRLDKNYYLTKNRSKTINFDPDSIIHDVQVKQVYGKVYELTEKEKEEYGIE